MFTVVLTMTNDPSISYRSFITQGKDLCFLLLAFDRSEYVQKIEVYRDGIEETQKTLGFGGFEKFA